MSICIPEQGIEEAIGWATPRPVSSTLPQQALLMFIVASCKSRTLSISKKAEIQSNHSAWLD
jgi:hypothetical protein